MIMNILVVFAFVSVNLVITEKQNVYSGYTVHDVMLRNASDQQWLLDLQPKLDLDIWQAGVPALREARVMVAPDKRDAFFSEVFKRGVAYSLYVVNISKALEEFDKSLLQFRSSKQKILQPFEGYMRYEEVNKYLEQIAAKHPNILTIESAGRSFEGRHIKYLKISTSKFADRSKPIYFMNAALHAREWVTVPVTLYCVHRLVEDLRPEDRDLLEDTDWIIMPIANPDGYEFTHTDRRLWRRTRSVRNGTSPECVGADANRNFDIAFNTFGASSNPCSETYPGVSAFSEPETVSIRNILHQHSGRIQSYLDLHSFGSYVLYGFGNYSLPKNKKQLDQVARTMAEHMNAVRLRTSVKYLYGNIANLMYPISGSAADYAQHVGVPLSFTVELPGFGHEFLVPARHAARAAMQAWRGIAAGARLARRYHTPRTRNPKLRERNPVVHNTRDRLQRG